jgi:UDP-N-acetylmuramyl pentapeptide phosphotransferase/UDP-N-acetylglucosamine-1-phosphate transferase
MSLMLAPFLSTWLICWLLIRFQGWHLTFSADHDFAGPQKFHTTITPRIGGLAIFIGLQIGLGVLVWTENPVATPFYYVMVASLPVFVAGLSEDLTKVVRVKWRLLAAFLSGWVFTALFEISVIRLDIPYLDLLLQNPWLAVLFLIIAIAGLSNAYNIIDGFNGLASMVAIISAAAILYIAFKVQDPLVMAIAFITIGAVLGFFIWNYPKGLIFLGDGGAYLIGFLIAVASVLLVVRNPLVSPWFALMVNAYPIFETLFTIWRRTVHQSRNPSMPDGAHFHSLIYRRIMRWAHHGNQPQAYLSNAKTSPYLWILSSLGILPAILWWDSTVSLMLASLGFVIFYVYVYNKIVSFQTPSWISKPSEIDKS